MYPRYNRERGQYRGYKHGQKTDILCITHICICKMSSSCHAVSPHAGTDIYVGWSIYFVMHMRVTIHCQSGKQTLFM